MNLKPLYKSESMLLIGLKSDFQELCVIDGLVIEVDIAGKKLVGKPLSGLKKLRSGEYTAIRQNEKRDYIRMIEKKLRRKMIKKIEEILEEPPVESIESLSWIPERLGGNGNQAK